MTQSERGQQVTEVGTGADAFQYTVETRATAVADLFTQCQWSVTAALLLTTKLARLLSDMAG